MAIVLRSELKFESIGLQKALTTTSEDVDYREFVFRLALAICGEREGAEDVAQDVLLTLFKHRDKLAAVDNPQAWVRRVTVRCATRYLKRKHRTEPLDSGHQARETAPETLAVYEVLR